MKRRLAAVTFLLALCVPPVWAQQKVISARAGLVTGVEGEVLQHCHEKGEGVRQLQAGERLHDGDRVFTTAMGRASWTLNADSYMRVAADSVVLVHDTNLDRMHFDVERGEVVVVIPSLKGGAALVVHAPPGLLTVHRPGRYLFRIAENGETEVYVEKGELRYEEKGKTLSVKKGRKVTFRRVEKKIEHGA